MPSLCRDCLTLAADPVSRPGRCARCGSPRLVAHPELSDLAIAHLDCDSFYAAVEKRDDPALADRPVIIGGGRRGVVSTACYIARIQGVRSAMPMFKALEACPDAIVIRPRMEVYAAVSHEIRALMQEATPLVEPLSLDEAFLDLRGTGRLHGKSPAEVMAAMARRIEEEIGITVSIGLSHNKFLAKIASDLDKPRGFSVIGAAETLEFLAPQPVSLIWGVGKSLRAKLEADGYRLIGDLRAAPPETLSARYGAMGRRLAELSRGEDARAIGSGGEMKSISAETTFDVDLGEQAQLEAHLWRLAVRVADRAKAKEVEGRTVTLKLKTPDFRPLSRRAAQDTPTQLADAIFNAARPLLAKTLDRGPFRLIGVGVSDLSPEKGVVATDLFDPAAKTRAAAERATDAIRARFGGDAIQKGRSLG